MVFNRGKRVIRKAPCKLGGVKLSFLAGSLSTHAFVALVPFIVVLRDILSGLGREQLANGWVGRISDSAGGPLGELLYSGAVGATEAGGISIFASVVLVMALVHLFHGLHEAFAVLYTTNPPPPLLDQLVDDVLIVGATTAVVIVARIVSGLVRSLLGGAVTAVNPVIGVTTVAAALLPMYYIFPDQRVTVGEVVPGALLAGVGWGILNSGFGVVMVRFSTPLPGPMGKIIQIVIYLYVGGLVVIFGIALNATIAELSTEHDSN